MEKKYGFSMKPVIVLVLLKVFTLSWAQKVYDHLGCWKDTINGDKSFLPKIGSLSPKDHASSLYKCAKAAVSNGIPVFGIRNNSACVGSVHASLNYMRYGPSTRCYNGTGGPRSMDVYSLDGNKGHIHAAEAQEKRNFIYDLYSSSYALNNAFVRKVPSNIAKHPLVRNGHVRPVVLQPLFKEIDERDFGAYRPPVSGMNILTNPGFEQPLVNDPDRKSVV